MCVAAGGGVMMVRMVGVLPDDRYECTSVVCGLVWFTKEENDDPTGNLVCDG